ncbi:uncharacterized protein [Palaemon carinicauda]|uniref:uncharacterized protein n=1 Tax=Palaemon carinicauda TaxID=392227 RepID=UPI0035B67D2F
MFQRTLILAAISAAFASGIPPSAPFASAFSPPPPFVSGIPPSAPFASVFSPPPPFVSGIPPSAPFASVFSPPPPFVSGIPPPTPCQTITDELRSGFLPDDPHTFPNISDFIYTRDIDNIYVSITFDFFNLTLKGFSNVNCNSFNVSGQPLTTLNLTGHDLEFDTSNFRLHINPPFSADGQRPSFDSQLRFYTLDLRFKIDSYIPDPFSLCITRDSLQMTFYAEGIRTYTRFPHVDQELNDHPKEVVEAINRYLPRLANNFTTALNNILCQTSR